MVRSVRGPTNDEMRGRRRTHVEIIPDLSNPLPCLTQTGLTHVSGLSTLAIL